VIADPAASRRRTGLVLLIEAVLVLAGGCALAASADDVLDASPTVCPTSCGCTTEQRICDADAAFEADGGQAGAGEGWTITVPSTVPSVRVQGTGGAGS
jgi:hypothetical protein